MLIVANWKAYVEDFSKAKKLFELSKKIVKPSTCRVVLAPPTPFLGALALKNISEVSFAAQDISTSQGGANTGENTAEMFASVGTTYAIVGHSERRAQGDTNEIIALKIVRALASNMTPILCVGEKERDRDGRYISFVREEITTALIGLTNKERARIIIAYEPLWAIGKSVESAILPNDLAEMVLYIRKVLAELLLRKDSAQSLVLYGGSVEPGNILGLANSTGVDGFLVGHSSVDESSFKTIVQQLS